MTRPDDPRPGGPTLTDEAVDAIVDGTTTDPALAKLAAFAREVQLLGEQPPPNPSPELAALLSGQDLAPSAETGAGSRVASARRRLAAGWGRAVGKVAGLGVAAKIGLGTAVAAAGVAGASTAGILPQPVDDAVRRVVEAVTPLDLDTDSDPGDGGREDHPSSGDPADRRRAGDDDPDVTQPVPLGDTTTPPGSGPPVSEAPPTPAPGAGPGTDQPTTGSTGQGGQRPASTSPTPAPEPTTPRPSRPDSGRPPTSARPGHGGSTPPSTSHGPPDGRPPEPPRTSPPDQGTRPPHADGPGNGRPDHPGRDPRR